MHLRYGDQIHVFSEWQDYESGGMTHEVFKYQEEFQAWLDKKTDGMDEQKALYFVSNLKVVIGSVYTLTVTEVVKQVKVK
ncbi:MAG TPA: hypothetical protein DDY18_04575 [Flavobacterium sp.]|jgi:hypothetical protein|nr:hypothetical protein [Flavobacterium sp.]